MPIKVTCSNCGGVLHAPDDAAGKKGRCPTCGTVLTIPAGGDPVSAGGFSPTSGPVAPPRPIPNPPEPPPSAFAPRPPAPTPYGLASDPRPANVGGGSSLAGGPPVPNRIAPPAAPVGSKLPPDPRRYSADPYTTGGPAAGARRAVADADRWRRVAGGLWWVRAAAVFGWLGIVGFVAVPVLQAFNVPVPDQTPGYLGMADVSSVVEIRVGATLVPLALALLCLAFGRMGISAAPPNSFAGGPAKASAFATLLVLAAFVAVAAMTVMGLKEGFVPNWKLKPGDNLQGDVQELIRGSLMNSADLPGIVQRFGLAAILAFGLTAEIWYVAALGRMAAALQSKKAAGRVNRFVLLIGLLFVLKVFGCVALGLYGTDWLQQNVVSKWLALEPPIQIASSAGAVALVGLVFMVIRVRLAGGVRGAIREYLDAAPGA